MDDKEKSDIQKTVMRMAAKKLREAMSGSDDEKLAKAWKDMNDACSCYRYGA